MNREQKDNDALKQSLQTADFLKGAARTGKSVSSVAKGASVGGLYGAAAAFLWENREFIKKAMPFIIIILMLPVLFMLMLPSLIFDGVTSKSDKPILNNDAAINKNIDEAREIVNNIVNGGYSFIVAEIENEINNLGEDEYGEIITPDSSQYTDALLIMSQYCAYKDSYEEINLRDFNKVLKGSSENLYTYTVSETIEIDTENPKNEEKKTITKYTYTISFVGEDYFGLSLFNLSEEKMLRSNEYAQNLMTFLYGTNFINGGYANVSDEVMAYETLIIEYATKYNIPEFVEVIKAIMMQESGGKLTDVMQSSECAYNTDYPKKPNGITDPVYSIDAGIHYFADALEMAGCSSPKDKSKLSLALQGYNYGLGYISWAIDNHGGYTETNALAFSNMMKAKLGWKIYGDPKYDTELTWDNTYMQYALPAGET